MSVLWIFTTAAVIAVLALAVARSGARRHQESLNVHERSSREPDDVRAVADRPADARAEPMGVRRPGEPSIDPE